MEKSSLIHRLLSLLGKYVKVHLDECKGFYYLGTLEENE